MELPSLKPVFVLKNFSNNLTLYERGEILGISFN
jgi:hypothetical protein